MDIGIMGAGHIGGSLTRRLAELVFWQFRAAG